MKFHHYAITAAALALSVQALACTGITLNGADGSRVIVVINYGDEPSEVSPEWGRRTRWQAYRTSDAEGENLKPVGETRGRETVVIPARSVVTLVGSSR